MLDADDVLELAPGVSVAGGKVHDAVRGTSWPVNETACWMLARSGLALGEIASQLSTAHGVPQDRARDDVLSFAWQLNVTLLANLRTERPRWRRSFGWLRLAVQLAPTGSLPPPRARRSALDTGSSLRAVASVGRGLAGRATTLACVTAALVAQLAVVAGTLAPMAAAAVGVGVGLGLLLHEAGHAIALRGSAAALVLAGSRTFVLHAPIGPRQRAAVAAAGPLVAAGTGLAAVGAATALDVIVLALVALPLCAHALAATVLSPDGRTACKL